MFNPVVHGSNKLVPPEIRPASTSQIVPYDGHSVRVFLNLPARDLLPQDFLITQNGLSKTPVSIKIDSTEAGYEAGRVWDIRLGRDWLVAGSAINVEYRGNAKITNFTAINIQNYSRASQRGIDLVQRQRSFSMHFSMATYTVPLDGLQLSPPTYSPTLFNPVGLTSAASIDNWITAAQAYGAESILVTAWHTDGFCLWDSASLPSRSIRAASTWWAANGFDIFGAFCTKARAAGLKVGVYTCIYDTKYELDNAALKISNITAWKAGYLARKLAQFTEICTNYGEIDELIIDAWGGVGVYPTYDQVDKTTILDRVKSLQPNCAIMINDYNRQLIDCDVNIFEIGVGVGDGIVGGTTTIEDLPNVVGGGGDFPRQDNQYPCLVWATPTLYGDSWFNDPANQTYESPEFFLALQAEVAARNGALMFNLSPDTTGLISPAKIAYLASLNP